MHYTQKSLCNFAAAILITATLIMLTACATPGIKVADRQFESGKLTRERVAEETGWQLLYGERNARVENLQYGVDKATMGVAGSALGVAAIGAATGNMAAGAVVGTIAGGVGQALATARDTQTSGSVTR